MSVYLSTHDNDFVSSIRNKHYHYFPSLVPKDRMYNWDQMMEQLDNHPRGGVDINHEKLRLNLNGLSGEISNPPKRYCLDILEDMTKIFTQNRATLIAFVGISPFTASYGMHADEMDVFYVQDRGKIEMVLENNVCIEMTSGDAIWLPRGRHHNPTPVGSRIGMSFGVEQGPDPCTYV